jgi:ABC-type polysaccharide/polyol phosphate export permease
LSSAIAPSQAPSSRISQRVWRGDSIYLLQQLILKDFRVRYRNMSLGLLWSVLNPLIMVGVYTFVFMEIFKSPIPHFPLFILSGLIPFNFFVLAWTSATNSILDNTSLIKRTPVMRELFPIAGVLSNVLHLILQLLMIVGLVIYFDVGFSKHWFWLPLVWGLELVFIIGLGMASAAINVYVRDTRYVVESLCLIIFWLVPIFYSFDMVPQQYAELYQYNPVAALVLASRRVILEAQAPHAALMWKLTIVSMASFALGLFIFRRLKRNFYVHL